MVSSGRVKLRALAKQISEISTVSVPDTVAVLEGLLAQIPKELSNGNIVELGDFGSFRLRVQTYGAETAEAVTANQIKKVLPRFVPGKELQQVLNNSEFEKA